MVELVTIDKGDKIDIPDYLMIEGKVITSRVVKEACSKRLYPEIGCLALWKMEKLWLQF